MKKTNEDKIKTLTETRYDILNFTVSRIQFEINTGSGVTIGKVITHSTSDMEVKALFDEIVQEFLKNVGSEE